MATDYVLLREQSDYQLSSPPILGKSNAGSSSVNEKGNDLTHLQLFRLNLIDMYVTDALNTRAPNRILKARGIHGYFNISIQRAYSLSHNSYWSILVYTVIWIHLLLIFMEPFANMDMANDYAYVWYLYAIEIMILCIYSIDIYLHYISHDKENYWNERWVKVIIVCIILNVIDIIASIIVTSIHYRGIFLHRFGAILRPLFLLTRSKFLRATYRSILKSIPRILDVLILVSLYILMFSVLGYVLFSKEQLGIGVHVSIPNGQCLGNELDTDCDLVQDDGNSNFDTLFESYLSLCVLMSTANFPDVMMPSLHTNKWTGIFFGLFIAFGIYYLMSIIFAVIYHHYHTDNAHYVAKMTNNRAKSLDYAFQQMVIFSKEIEAAQYEWMHHLDFNQERIYFSAFRTFMQFRRPKLKTSKVRILYNALCEVRKREDAVTKLSLETDEGVGISRENFQNLYLFVNVEIFRDPSYAVDYRLKQKTQSLQMLMMVGDEKVYDRRGICCNCCKSEQARRRKSMATHLLTNTGDRSESQFCILLAQKLYFIWLRLRAILYRIFTHVVVSRIIDLTVWIGTLVLIYQVSHQDEHNETLANVSIVLIYIFTIEVTLRFIAFGKYFLSDNFNVLDLCVVYASLFIDLWEISHGGRTQQSNGIVAFRLLRFVRALATIERFKLIISTSVTVLKTVGVLMSLEFCVFYIFAVIGIYCFGGSITKEIALQKLQEAVDRADVDDITFWEYIRDSYYYDNNVKNHRCTCIPIYIFIFFR